VSQEFQAGLAENTLFFVNDQTVVLQLAKHLLKVKAMFGRRPTGHQQIVQIDKNARHVKKQLVHHLLEGHAGVAESEWHSKEFEEAERRNNRPFRNVLRPHWHQQVTLLQVQLREDGSALQSGRQVRHVGQRVPVFGGDQI
jgi:hypothetical protein